MARILYYDCWAGMCGGMNLGALLDLGVPLEHLREHLGALNLPGWSLEARRESRGPIQGTLATVRRRHDGHVHGRAFAEIRDLIRASALSTSVRDRALAIYTGLAQAEADAHGVSVDRVHFHEVGEPDAVVDIVGAAICLEWLAPDQVWCGPVELGGGTVRCSHGLLPVPAPATARILATRGIPVTLGRLPYEATTPTGAAILAAVVDHFAPAPPLVMEKVGYGLGSRDPASQAALRVWLAHPLAESAPPPRAPVDGTRLA